MDQDDDAFWELTAAIDAEEARTRARDELAGERPTFEDLLRRIPAGEVVTLVTLDGTDLRGRVLEVGRAVVRIGEVREGSGAQGRRVVRCHDIRLAAVARMTREDRP